MHEATSDRPSPRGPGIAGGVALLLLAAFWLATVFGTGAQPPPAPRMRAEVRLRRLFETNAPGIRTLALGTNVVLHAFGERRGSEQVVVARSRQGPVLFLADELAFERADPATRPLYRQSVASVRARLAELRARGVARVVVLPVPTKFAVLAQADPSVSADACAAVSGRGASSAAAPPAACDGSVTASTYRELARTLADEPGVAVAALHDPFVSEARAGRTLYAFEDTHWTSYGLALGARETLRAWRGTAPEPVRAGTLPDQRGDLQRMLALPDLPWLRTHPLADERYDLPAAAAPCQGAVFLLGSSYSRHADGLGALLQRGSGCPVVDLSDAGRDADFSFGPLYTHHGHALAGAVVVWELPFRSLLTPGAFDP